MALGVEVGFDPSDIVLDGNRAPPPQKGEGEPPPILGPYLLWPNGWMHQDDTRYGGGPGDFVLDGYPAPKFSAHVCYSYCDFVRTLHHRYWFAVVQVHVLFLEKSLIVLTVFQYKY